MNRSTVIFLITIASAGCQPRAIRTGAPESATAETIPPQVVAEKLLKAYRTAGSLTFSARLSGRPIGAHPSDPLLRLRVDTDMATGKLKCTMYDGVDTNEPMVELIIEGLEASQKVWEVEGVKVFNFEAQTAGAIDTLPNKNERTRKTGCLYGSLLQSWVGRDSAQSKFFAEGIADSIYAGRAELDGHECLILSWDRGVDDQANRRVDRFWVDASLYVLRRWDTLESTQHDPLAITRSREYENLRLWTLEAFQKLSESDPTQRQ